jgi:hypothetical protein
MNILKFAGSLIGLFSKLVIFVLAGVAIYLLITIFVKEGLSGVRDTIKIDVAGMVIKFIPIMVVFFVMAGSINHLATKNPQEVKDILAGKKGKIMMMALAASMPGPAGGLQLQHSWNAGGNKVNVLLSLVAMMALGITTLLFRAKVLGPQLTVIWLFMGLILLGQVWLVCKISTRLANDKVAITAQK